MQHLRMAEQVFYTGTGTRSLEIVSNLRIPNGMRGGAKSSKSVNTYIQKRQQYKLVPVR